MKTICHNFYGTIIFNASALQEELGYSSGWQRILVQLVVACSLRLVDMRSVCSCRICFEVRKEFGKYFSIGVSVSAILYSILKIKSLMIPF